jgi:hypothetical protein
MVAVDPVTKFAEQVLMFILLVARPEVTYIPGRGSGRRQCPDVFECPQNDLAQCRIMPGVRLSAFRLPANVPVAGLQILMNGHGCPGA